MPRVSNDSEWEILQSLWLRERATAREVTEDLEESRGWAYSTVKTLLDRMVDKDLVRARRVGNVWEYTPAVEESAAQRSAFERFVDLVCGGSLAPALEFIAQDPKLSKKDRDFVREMLAKSQEKKGGRS